MTTRGERLFCDTNVLLTAIDKGRSLHGEARHVLDEIPNRAQLCISGQVVRDCLAVSTRPREANGLGQSMKAALDNVQAILERTMLLEETREVTSELLTLLRKTRCSGKQVHDANIVATMVGHGLRKLITDNAEDFRRFDTIEIVNLADVER